MSQTVVSFPSRSDRTRHSRLSPAGDLQRELACDGVRAAAAKGRQGRADAAPPWRPTGWAPSAPPARRGRSITARAREHGVSRAIRTADADLMRDRTTIDQEDVRLWNCRSPLGMPDPGTGSLRANELEPAERAALDQGMTVRRGQGAAAPPPRRTASADPPAAPVAGSALPAPAARCGRLPRPPPPSPRCRCRPRSRGGPDLSSM